MNRKNPRRLRRVQNKKQAAFPAEAFDLERADGWAHDVMQIVRDNFFPSSKQDAVEAEGAEKTGTAASK